MQTPPPTPRKPGVDEHGAQVTDQLDRQGAVGGVDTGSTGNRPYLYSGLTKKNCVLRYRRTWNIYTYPYAKQILTCTTLNGETGRKILTTSMAAFPTDLLTLYMSEAEYSLLPPECYLRSTKNTLSLVHATTSYQTNESTVANATASVQLLIDYCKGAVLKGHGVVCKYESAGTNVMIPTTATPLKLTDVTALDTLLWNGAPPQPPATVGIMVPNDWYLVYCMQTGTDGEGYPDIDHLYGTAVAVTNYNTEFMTHEHNYGIIMLKNQRTPTRLDISNRGNATTGLEYEYPFANREDVCLMTNVSTTGADNVKTRTDSAYGASATDTTRTKSFVDLDHFRLGMHERKTQELNPWIYAGLRAIEGISGKTLEYQDGVAYWQYECELELEINFDSFTHKVPTKSYLDYIYSVVVPPPTNKVAVQTDGPRNDVHYWGRAAYKFVNKSTVEHMIY